MTLGAGTGRVGLLCAAAVFVGCDAEMSPTVTVTNQTDQVVRGVRVDLAGVSLDIPPLRSGEKARLPYTPVLDAPRHEVSVLWRGKITTLPLPAAASGGPLNNVELVLADSGVHFDD